MERVKQWQRGLRRFAYYYDNPPLVTLGLLTSFLALHLATGFGDYLGGQCDGWGVVFGERSSEILTAFGGRSRVLVWHGQVWRLLTAGFLHADPSHIFFNGLAFWGLGRLAEATFGRARLLLLFLTSVIGGSMLSQLGHAPLSIGASGGVFGIMGALVVFGWRTRRDLPPPIREIFGKRLWPWILLNLLIGAALPMIDQLGHVGGLITGSICGLVLANRVTDHGEGSSLAQAMITVSAFMLSMVVPVGIALSLRG